MYCFDRPVSTINTPNSPRNRATVAATYGLPDRDLVRDQVDALSVEGLADAFDKVCDCHTERHGDVEQALV